jgi:hypothetical protein
MRLKTSTGSRPHGSVKRSAYEIDARLLGCGVLEICSGSICWECIRKIACWYNALSTFRPIFVLSHWTHIECLPPSTVVPSHRFGMQRQCFADHEHATARLAREIWHCCGRVTPSTATLSSGQSGQLNLVTARHAYLLNCIARASLATFQVIAHEYPFLILGIPESEYALWRRLHRNVEPVVESMAPHVMVVCYLWVWQA